MKSKGGSEIQALKGMWEDEEGKYLLTLLCDVFWGKLHKMNDLFGENQEHTCWLGICMKGMGGT